MYIPLNQIRVMNGALQCNNSVVCEYSQAVSAYQAEIKLNNIGDSPIFLNIVSSFAMYLKETTGERIIKGRSESVLRFKIKATNIISKTNEKIVIYYSSDELMLLTVLEDQRREINLVFKEDFVEDQVIHGIVKCEAGQLCNEGMKCLNNKNAKDGLRMYEEAFQLYRHFSIPLLNMAKCDLMLGKPEAALQNIQTALLFDPCNKECLLVKLKINMYLFHSGICKNDELLMFCEQMVKQVTALSGKMQQVDQQQLYSLIQQLKDTLTAMPNKLEYLMKKIIAKASQDYESDEQLRKVYPTKKMFEGELRNLFMKKQQTERSIATPDEVLDPINYEIMVQPMIVPTGISYSKEMLDKCLQKHGPRDPLTRVHLQPDWAVPNLNLQRYIHENPDLRAWKQFELKASRFH